MQILVFMVLNHVSTGIGLVSQLPAAINIDKPAYSTSTTSAGKTGGSGRVLSQSLLVGLNVIEKVEFIYSVNISGATEKSL